MMSTFQDCADHKQSGSCTDLPRRVTAIVTSHFERNHLLAALPRSVLDRLLPQLESVELRLGQVLHEAHEIQRHVFFPTTAIVSLLCVMENGAAAEIAVFGDDGIVGVPLFMAHNTLRVAPW